MGKQYGLHQGVFHCVKNCIHTEGKFTYKINNVHQNELQKDMVFDEYRLKKRLLKEIVKKNNARANKYPSANINQITEDIPFRLSTFYADDDNTSSSAGTYSLFPLEFLCKKCGKVYEVKLSKDLVNIPPRCNCGGELEQNTIVLYCEECGTISTMGLYCSVKDHGRNYAHLDRKTKDDIATWRAFCSKCKESGIKGDIDFLRYKCPKCKNGKRIPLSVRDGGVYTPVTMTFIDLHHKPTGEYSDYMRMAVDSGTITLDGIECSLSESKRGKIPDVLDLIDSVRRMGADPLGSDEYRAANEYISDAIIQIQKEYEGVDLDILNDVRHVRDTSKSFDQYLNSLPENESQPLREWFLDAKHKFGLQEIYYSEDLKVIMASIGQIIGINKFYEDGFIPHFEPFRSKRDAPDIYAMIVPITTEGILFRLDPVKVCNWLYKNNLTNMNISTTKEAVTYLTHLITDSKEYMAVKTLIHTYSHILIKQSNIFTGLDETTCAELIFPLDASFMIYSTSNVNIGGFEYAFNYSLPNWFSRVKEAAEDCTFDPSCMKEGGRCFSCMHVAEFVCCDFNKELSRQTLVGKQSVERGYLYEYGFWE